MQAEYRSKCFIMVGGKSDLGGLTHGQTFIIWMIIPVKNNSNDKFLARVYAN